MTENHRTVRWLPALVLALGATPLGAQEAPPLATDRPDQTEGAALVPRGLIQLEVGASHAYDREDAGPAGRTWNLGGALVRVGVADPVELRAGFAGWQRERADGFAAASGLGDLSLGAKVRLSRGNGVVPAVALISGLVLPVGDTAFRAEGVDPAVRVAVAHDLGHGVSLGYNAGVFWTTVPVGTGDQSLEPSLLFSIVLGRTLLPALGAFVEVYGVHGLADGAVSWLALDSGITVPIRANLQYDLSAGLGISSAATDWFVSTGLSVRLPR